MSTAVTPTVTPEIASPTLTANQDPIAYVQVCLALAREYCHHQEANQAFNQLQDNLAIDHPIAAEVLRLIWNELLATHRSAAFLEQLFNIERQFAEQMTQSHAQLHQNS